MRAYSLLRVPLCFLTTVARLLRRVGELVPVEQHGSAPIRMPPALAVHREDARLAGPPLLNTMRIIIYNNCNGNNNNYD